MAAVDEIVCTELDAGLVLDVAHVIEDHGYPALNDAQLGELRLHLHHLLHGEPDEACRGGAA
jgi:hypothetical protein